MSLPTFFAMLTVMIAGTYGVRLAGVLIGQRLQSGVDGTDTDPGTWGTAGLRRWLDVATVMLIGAVFVTSAVFDGTQLADAARWVGAGVGVVAALMKVPMLGCVVIGMVTCAAIRVLA